MVVAVVVIIAAAAAVPPTAAAAAAAAAFYRLSFPCIIRHKYTLLSNSDNIIRKFRGTKSSYQSCSIERMRPVHIPI